MATIELNQFPIHYEVDSEFAEIPLLFVHGNLASNIWWRPFREEWRRQQLNSGGTEKAYYFEWRGCGGSKGLKSEDEVAIPLLAADLIQFIHRLKIHRPLVIGHSTGGLIAMAALAERPELFRGAVLLDSVGPAGIAVAPEMLAAFSQMQSDRDICAAVMETTIHGVDAQSRLFQEIVDAAFQVDGAIWNGVPKAISQINVTDQLKRVNLPIHVWHGEHDVVIPHASSEHFASELPNAHFTLLSGQGHSCNVENPSRFTDLLVQVIRDLMSEQQKPKNLREVERC